MLDCSSAFENFSSLNLVEPMTMLERQDCWSTLPLMVPAPVRDRIAMTRTQMPAGQDTL